MKCSFYSIQQCLALMLCKNSTFNFRVMLAYLRVLSEGLRYRVELTRLCDEIEMRALIHQAVISRVVDVHSHSINGEITN